ncbi:hypothetical protein ACFL6I_02275 [candidate division KSB1 bacterium]
MKVVRTVKLNLTLKNSPGQDFETEMMDANGHIYIYRYTAENGIFFRATLPSGAAAPVFLPLSNDDKVPVGGWIPVSA